MKISTYAALDVGEVRIGVALTPKGVRIAQPYGVIANDQSVVDAIKNLISSEQITALAIGLPRGLQGQETDQTRYVRKFVKQLQSAIGIPIHLQDEALTSVKAEAELTARGKEFAKGEIDALAACYILEDFLSCFPRESDAQ